MACAAFNAKAEVNPFSWGAKIGPSLSFATASDDTKINGNKASGKFLIPFLLTVVSMLNMHLTII